MSFTVNSHCLSALSPVKFVYNYHTEKKLAGTQINLKGGFSYYKHDALYNFKDAALSKKTGLFLTDVKALKDIFQDEEEQVSIGSIAGSLYLKAKNAYITKNGDFLYIGGAGTKLFITLIPLENSFCELKVSKTQFIRIDKEYPYTARISEETLDETEIQYKQFAINYSNNLISFKVKTPEGYRFLSYGTDKVLRAVGLELNDTIINPYHFEAEYKTNTNLTYGYNPNAKETKYYNSLLTNKNKTNVNIKDETENNTNLLISCPTLDLSKSDTVNVNIALLKTNFSSSGTFRPSI